MSFPTKKAQQLKKQFHSTRKGDDETIEFYVKRLKSIADSVAAIESPISDSDMVLQLVAALPSEYEPVKKIISSKWPLPTFEEACSMVSMQERKFLQDHHEEQNTTDPRVVGEEESSAFTTLEKVGTVVGAVGIIVGAVSTVVGAVTAVGALPTVAGAVGASRMIVGGAVCAMGAVASWSVWQSQKKNYGYE
ncbi:uncharacterized protein LOC132626174 [Lycium barbarum]|uniref:uncharacterized protein LOC132626174 n=1 Tax=Lycium barbarum TaxID=112863 RepID=UPI00293E6D67|nr:uncharacterized protein LOC132626174 [Lycium barbarum]